MYSLLTLILVYYLYRCVSHLASSLVRFCCISACICISFPLILYINSTNIIHVHTPQAYVLIGRSWHKSGLHKKWPVVVRGPHFCVGKSMFIYIKSACIIHASLCLSHYVITQLTAGFLLPSSPAWVRFNSWNLTKCLILWLKLSHIFFLHKHRGGSQYPWWSDIFVGWSGD